MRTAFCQRCGRCFATSRATGPCPSCQSALPGLEPEQRSLVPGGSRVYVGRRVRMVWPSALEGQTGVVGVDAAGPGSSGLNGFDASHSCRGQRLQRVPVIVAERPPAGGRHNDRRLDDQWASVLLGPLHGEESHHPKVSVRPEPENRGVDG